MSLRDRITSTIRASADAAVRSLRGVARRALGVPAEAPSNRVERRRQKGARGSLATGQLRVPVIEDWDVVDVRDALREHEEGIFRTSALLVDSMGRQDRISGVLDTRINAVLSMPFDVLSADESDAAKSAAMLLRPRWSRMVTRGNRASAARWLVTMGFVVCHRVWERDPRTGLWDVRLVPWHPTWVRWDHPAGVYRVQTTTGTEAAAPDGSNARWCVITLLDEDRPWMQGALRRLAIPFLIISWAYRDWARWSEKHGLPPLGARVPNEERFRQATDRFLDDLQQLASEPTILLPLAPDGKIAFDLEWKELKNWQSYQGFQDLAKAQETNVAIALLGQNLTTEVQGGSYAAAQAHMLVRRDFLTTTATALDDGERRFLAAPWTRVNVEADPVRAEAIAPKPTTDTTPPVDEKTEAETSKAKADAVKAWREAGASVDVDRSAREAGVKLVAAQPAPDPTSMGEQPITGAKAPAKYDHISFRPPQGVADAARRGLDLYDQGLGGAGLVASTISAAHRLVMRHEITPERVRKMRAWFRRHEVDRKPDWAKPPVTPGYVAWMLWGGDAGQSWAEKVVRQMEAADAAESNS